MIEIPWPLFISIYIVFLIGMVFGKINRYLRICIIILFFVFWFSFDATLTPDTTELFSSSISTSDTREDIEFVDVFIAILWVVFTGILLYLTQLFIRRILT